VELVLTASKLNNVKLLLLGIKAPSRGQYFACVCVCFSSIALETLFMPLMLSSCNGLFVFFPDVK
jgi:hypothetical protein